MRQFSPSAIRMEDQDPGLIEEGEANRRRIVSFNSAARQQHHATIRATAMVFHDPASQELKEDMDRVAPSNATILVIGETGTGKELVARYIHAQSDRCAGPFVAVNCGALSDTLAEAELFGYEKGAFTGAVRSQVGWFEAANGGTLFLDEIGDLSLSLQVKLLRVLQEREVVRVGSRQSIPIDIRIIAATNVDLQSAIQTKSFREDLYFRLNVATIHLPPLRDRPGDIEPLAQYFLDLYNTRLGRPAISFSPQALTRLHRYTWPGNIRELENVVHNAVLLSRGTVLEPTELRLSNTTKQCRNDSCDDFETGIQNLVERAILEAEPGIFDRAVRAIIRTAYDCSDGNQVRASVNLGMSRNAFRTQLSHLGTIASRRRTARGASDEGAAPIFKGAADKAEWPAVTMRIGYQKHGFARVLNRPGVLENTVAGRKVRVAWREFASGPDLIEALDRQEIDYCIIGEVPSIFAQAAGIPLVYLGYEPSSPHAEALVVRADSSVLSVKDLKGKVVAFNKGENVQYLLSRLLENHGMSFADIRCAHLGPEEALRQIKLGQVDAWVIWDPLLTAAQFECDLRIVSDGKGLVSNHQFHLSSVPFARHYPEIVAAFLGEVKRVGRYVEQHPAEVAQTVGRETGLAPQALELALRRLSYGISGMDDVVVRQQQAIADSFHAAGALRIKVSVRDAVWQGRDILCEPV